MNPFTVVTPSTGEIGIVAARLSYDGVNANPLAFENFTAPSMEPLFNTLRVSESWHDFRSHFNLPEIFDRSNQKVPR
jgi:hypothetical protein